MWSFSWDDEAMWLEFRGHVELCKALRRLRNAAQFMTTCLVFRPRPTHTRRVALPSTHWRRRRRPTTEAQFSVRLRLDDRERKRASEPWRVIDSPEPARLLRKAVGGAAARRTALSKRLTCDGAWLATGPDDVELRMRLLAPLDPEGRRAAYELLVAYVGEVARTVGAIDVQTSFLF